jgi:hypothetical protein
VTVYAENSSIPARVGPHASLWSHLSADNQDELHEFAARLGLRRSWYQPGRPRSDGRPSPFGHYDLTAGKRQQAIQLGARPVTWQDAPNIIRQRETTIAVQPLGANPATDVPAAERSLREQTTARLAAAGIDAGEPGLSAIVRHNAQLGVGATAAAETEREPWDAPVNARSARRDPDRAARRLIALLATFEAQAAASPRKRTTA